MTKKIFNYIKSESLNPILLIIIFTIIGGIFSFLFQDGDKAIEYFLTFIGIGISVAVVQCAFIQNKIQKDNIKIQLFDKRYAVFQVVLDSVTIIKRDNWDRYLLFKDNDINKQIIEIEENLYKSVQLATCLFDKDIQRKLIDVNNAFCKVSKSYKNMLVSNAKDFTSQENVQAFKGVLSSYILSQTELNSNKFDEILKDKFPKAYINIMDFNKECDAYLSFINKCEIIKDFEKYINVDKLGK